MAEPGGLCNPERGIRLPDSEIVVVYLEEYVSAFLSCDRKAPKEHTKGGKGGQPLRGMSLFSPFGNPLYGTGAAEGHMDLQRGTAVP